jgi:hypothetical protein
VATNAAKILQQRMEVELSSVPNLSRIEVFWSKEVSFD